MDIKQLKLNIENNTIQDDLIIFKNTSDSFLSEQYINEISKIKNKEIFYIDDLNFFNSVNTLIEDNYLYVYKTQKLTDAIKINNLIIVCNEIDKDIYSEYQYSILELPKLEKWQIKDYVATQLAKVNEDKIDWLCNVTNYNIFKLKNEINKIKSFGDGSQNLILDSLIQEFNYSNLQPFNIFDLSSSVLKKDINKLNEILSFSLNIDPLALTHILEKNFTNLLHIKTNPKINPTDLGLNYNQFLAIKYTCNLYTDTQIAKILKFLFSIDKMIKLGDFPYYDNLIDYILINILGV